MRSRVRRRLVPARWMLAAAVALVGATWTIALWLMASPCTGDTTCAAQFGLIIGAPLATVLSIGLACWWVARRASILLLAALVIGLLALGLFVSGALGVFSVAMLGIVAASVIVVVGAIEELASHRTERWLTAAVTGLGGLWLLAIGQVAAGAIVAGVGVWLAIEATVAVPAVTSSARPEQVPGAATRPSASTPPPSPSVARWAIAQVWIFHGLALAALGVMTALVLQPTGEGIAFWVPEYSVFLLVSIWLIAANVIAWSRWWRYRPLVAIDLLALIPVAIVSIPLLFIPALVVAGLLLFGITSAMPVRPVPGATAGPRDVRGLLLAAMLLPVAVAWWAAVRYAFDSFGPLLPYAISEVCAGGVALVALILWLDRRPAALFGVGVAAAYQCVVALINLSSSLSAVPLGPEYAEFIVELGLTAIGAVAMLVAAGRDVIRLPEDRSRAVAGLIAGVTAVLLAAEPRLAFLGLVLAILLERRSEHGEDVGGAAAGEGLPEVRTAGPDPTLVA